MEIDQIIPPRRRQYREGFTNTPLIDKLNYSERQIVETSLIGKLCESYDKIVANKLSANQLSVDELSVDSLIVETLAYMKSTKSLPVLNDLLAISTNNFEKLVISAYIFKINSDEAMIDIALQLFLKFQDKFEKILGFIYLEMFQAPATNALIKEHVNDNEYLISYNAKRHLGLLK